MESRSQPGPATLGLLDANVAVLLRAGFSGRQATRVYNVVDSYVYGFALQEATLPFSSPEEMATMSDQVLAAVADAYPSLAVVQRDLVASGFDYADEFEAGLDIIMGALPDPGTLAGARQAARQGSRDR